MTIGRGDDVTPGYTTGKAEADVAQADSAAEGRPAAERRAVRELIEPSGFDGSRTIVDIPSRGPAGVRWV